MSRTQWLTSAKEKFPLLYTERPFSQAPVNLISYDGSGERRSVYCECGCVSRRSACSDARVAGSVVQLCGRNITVSSAVVGSTCPAWSEIGERSSSERAAPLLGQPPGSCGEGMGEIKEEISSMRHSKEGLVVRGARVMREEARISSVQCHTANHRLKRLPRAPKV